jgi:hypothetical protein
MLGIFTNNLNATIWNMGYLDVSLTILMLNMASNLTKKIGNALKRML